MKITNISPGNAMRDIIERTLTGIGVVAACLLVVGAVLLGLHLWTDHNVHHFNAQLIEGIRNAVLEKHPELRQPPAAPPTGLTPPPPLEEGQ